LLFHEPVTDAISIDLELKIEVVAAVPHCRALDECKGCAVVANESCMLGELLLCAQLPKKDIVQ
jgi:hypothetical protein